MRTEQATSYAHLSTVLERIAAELGGAACDLAEIESHLAEMARTSWTNPAGAAKLQALDMIGQKLRALETFFYAAAPFVAGRIDLDEALAGVRLEGVCARLAGESEGLAAPGDIDLW